MTRIPIEAVLAFPSHQRAACERLAKHCRLLDGTEVRLIHVPDAEEAAWRVPSGARKTPALAAHTLNFAARAVGRKPFFWLEHDAIPLKAGWLAELSAEYWAGGKDFMLSADSHPPHDLVGGIGIYGPDTSWLIPRVFPSFGWDLWMVKHLRPLIRFTTGIQHSYGTWHRDRNCSLPHRFPKEQAIIRGDALVFHKDHYQDLLNPEARPDVEVFRHTGDLGDIIASLAVVKAKGGGRYVITPHHENIGGPRERMSAQRASFVLPLLAAQPYIQGAEFVGDPNFRATHDFSLFRAHTKSHVGNNLALWHAEHMGVPGADLVSQWLSVTPDAKAQGRVIVSRSPRYHNPAFPWRALLRRHKHELLFIGLPQEHAELSRIAGFRIPAARIGSALDIARLIAGSKLFIGNQSFPCWIAMALGHPLIQETCPDVPDSIVPRPNARFILHAADARAL